MANELNVRTGDTVAVIVGGKPNHTAKVSKAGDKRIWVNGYIFFGNGRPFSTGLHNWRLSSDAAIIAEIQGQRAEEAQNREEKRARIREQDNRQTFQLANQISSSNHRQFSEDYALSDLELLGEEYLQRILDDIQNAKAAANV